MNHPLHPKQQQQQHTVGGGDDHVRDGGVGLIQRMAIVHLDLSILSGSGYLDERASMEEWKEQILYFYKNAWHHNHINMEDCYSPTTISPVEWYHPNYDNEEEHDEAVSFVALATALFTLPTSLDFSISKQEEEEDNDNDDCNNDDKDSNHYQKYKADATQVVYLQQSMLVFVILESYPRVVAIVQVARNCYDSHHHHHQNNRNSYGSNHNDDDDHHDDNDRYDDDYGSSSALAIQSSIQQSYKLFCLLRGGGIHYRLIREEETSNTITTNCNTTTSSSNNNRTNLNNAHSIHNTQSSHDTIIWYPSMGRLYELRKRMRETKHMISSTRNHDKDEGEENNCRVNVHPKTNENDWNTHLEYEIQELILQLPISQIRSDLCVHFNDHMEELIGIGTYHRNSVQRCLVHWIPTPIPSVTGRHRTISSTPLPLLPSSSSSRNMTEPLWDQPLLSTIQLLVDDNVDVTTSTTTTTSSRIATSPWEPRLLGITTFHADQFRSTIYPTTCHDLDLKFTISPKTAHTIMSYIASYRYKILINQHHHPPYPISHNQVIPGTPPRFQRLSLPFDSIDGPSGGGVTGDDSDCLVSVTQKQSQPLDDSSCCSLPTNTRFMAQFLSPPPLSMLSATDLVQELHHGPHGQRIWAPRFYIPQTDNDDDMIPIPTSHPTIGQQQPTILETNVIVFDIQDWTFLLYFSPHSVFSSNELTNTTITPPSGDASSSSTTTTLIPTVFLESCQPLLEKLEFVSSTLVESVEELLRLDSKSESSSTTASVSLPNNNNDDNDKNSCSLPLRTTSSSVLEWNEPGQDVIFVDRTLNKILLFSDRLLCSESVDRNIMNNKKNSTKGNQKKTNTSNNSNNNRSHTRKSPSRGFFSRFKIKMTSSSSSNSSQPSRQVSSSIVASRRELVIPPTPDLQTVNLDCRHFLASSLPDKILDALDDVMIQVQQQHQQQKHEQLLSSLDKNQMRTTIETLTLTEHGWVYGRQLNKLELYVVLDPNLYKTVTDVQLAVARIRHELLREDGK